MSRFFDRLTRRSRANFYAVHELFEWPDQLPEAERWLSFDLLTLAGTEHAQTLTESTLLRLARFETVNLFSIFMRGESELLQTILSRCTRADFAECFDYLTHFIDEENKHMWFFAEFCRRYHGGVYPNRALKLSGGFPEDVEEFLAFMRILVFEEIGDFINVRVAADALVCPFVRSIHQVHHRDEAGHIAAGWSIAERLLCGLRSRYQPDELNRTATYLRDYMSWSLQSFYNPLAYRDAGIAEPYRLRGLLLAHPARHEMHARMLARTNQRMDKMFARLQAVDSGLPMVLGE